MNKLPSEYIVCLEEEAPNDFIRYTNDHYGNISGMRNHYYYFKTDRFINHYFPSSFDDLPSGVPVISLAEWRQRVILQEETVEHYDIY